MKTFNFHQQKTLNIEVYNSLMEKALERKPNSLLFLIKVFNIKLTLDAFEEADDYFSKILSHQETTSQTLYDIAKLFYKAGKISKALICLNKIEPEGSLILPMLILKANCFIRLNQYQEVHKINSRLILQFPEHEEVLLISAKEAYKNQDFSNAIEKCNLILKKNPNSVRTHEILISAHFNINQVPLIEPFINYKELVKTYSLADQVSSIVNFNDEINQALHQKVHWMSQPSMYSTKKGDQLDKILAYEDEIIKQLTDLFSSRVLDYLNSIKALNLPYFNVQSDTLTYDMWAVRLNSGGHQVAHLHPAGWISGVYYTSLPKLNKTLNEGALEFGVDYPRNKFKSLYTVQPEEGTLILFPSYYLHKTVPFESEKQRICISFDIFPYTQES